MQELDSTMNVVYANPVANEFTFYMDTDIGDPSEYRTLFQVLQNASENDVVKIMLNSHGGYLHSCLQIVSNIRASQATVVGVLQGVAYSAAGAILLSCDAVEIAPHSAFMAHTSIGGGGFDKLSDSTRSIEHSNKQLERFYRDAYEGFFTESEITDILNGLDMWLCDEEIHERFMTRAEYMQAKQEEFLAEMEGPSREELSKMTKTKIIDYFMGDNNE